MPFLPLLSSSHKKIYASSCNTLNLTQCCFAFLSPFHFAGIPVKEMTSQNKRCSILRVCDNPGYRIVWFGAIFKIKNNKPSFSKNMIFEIYQLICFFALFYDLSLLVYKLFSLYKKNLFNFYFVYLIVFNLVDLSFL